MMGGFEGGRWLNDVWTTTDGGQQWTETCHTAPWSPRSGQVAVVAANATLMLFGGGSYTQNGDDPPVGHPHNDMWLSHDGGVTWREGPGAPWAPRLMFQVAMLPNDTLLLLGGSSGYGADTVNFNDVWSSSDGLSWVQLEDRAPWPARSGFVAAATSSCVIVSGGASSVTTPGEWLAPLAPCPAGRFACTFFCARCPSGAVSNFGALTCTACPPGRFTSNSTTCQPCSAGTFAAGRGSSRCAACADGTFCPAGSSNERECPPGHECPNAQSCKPCDKEGLYQPWTNRSSCKQCEPGWMCPPVKDGRVWPLPAAPQHLSADWDDNSNGLMIRWDATLTQFRLSSYQLRRNDTRGQIKVDNVSSNANSKWLPASKLTTGLLTIDVRAVDALGQHGVYSKTFQYPVPTSDVCSPACSRNGVCRDSSCECFTEWSGPTCESWAVWKICLAVVGAIATAFSLCAGVVKLRSACKRRKRERDLKGTASYMALSVQGD